MNILPNFKTYYRAIVIRRYTESTDPWNRIEVRNRSTLPQLISEMDARITGYLHGKKLRGPEVFPFGSVVENPPDSIGATGSVPAPGRAHIHMAAKPLCHNC